MTSQFAVVMVLYSFGMSCGQVLFKLAALQGANISLAKRGLGFLNLYLGCGLVLYALLTFLWVWILKSVPLSRAYPFVALAFVFTPVLSRIVFGEIIKPPYFAGLGLIAAGVIVTAQSA